jgi:hypothetical protein
MRRSISDEARSMRLEGKTGNGEWEMDGWSLADDQADSLGGTGVTLYEISERVTFDPDSSSPGVIRRNATAPLQGFAELGTPLCHRNC